MSAPKNFLALLAPVFLIIAFLFIAKAQTAYSAIATHVVISEVQIIGSSSNDEFVEIYNPSSTSVDISGWKITKKPANLSTLTDLATIPASTSIAPHGYYLIAHTDYDGAVLEDLTYSEGIIAPDNIIYLKNGDTVIDKVGLGDGNDPETATVSPNPTANKSVERKASSSSTKDSMSGADALLGNGEDTDNNSLDFIIRDAADPQNSTSAVEPVIASPSPSPSESASPSPSVSPSPSASPTATPTPSPTPEPSPTVTPSPSATPEPSPTVTPSPTPSATPVPTPSPTSTPSPTPTPTPSPTATPVPSPSPTVVPSATPTPTPSATPSTSPSPTSSPNPSITPSPTPTVLSSFTFFNQTRVCELTYRTIHFSYFSLNIPSIRCYTILNEL